MSESEGADLCDYCQQGTVLKRFEEIAFHQQTERGYVYCKVTIPIGVCDQCGMKEWDDTAEAIIEEAVRRELDRLG